MIMLYEITVTYYGDYTSLDRRLWTLNVSLIIHGIITGLVQVSMLLSLDLSR